jgi:PEP-CTERM motif
MKTIFKKCTVALLGTVLSLLSIGGAQGQATIGVNPFAATTNAFSVGDIGGSNPGLGETFTVPANNPVLEAIDLYATTDFDADAGINASVYQWSPGTNTPVGSSVWSSTTPQIVPGSTFSTVYLETFSTGGVLLNPADDYIFEFTAFNSALVTGEPAIDSVLDATYPNGVMVAFNNSTYLPQTGANLDFTASFTEVPEPSTWALLLSGLGLVAFLRSRVRKA